MQYVKTLFWTSLLGLAVVLGVLVFSPKEAICYSCKASLCVASYQCGAGCYCSFSPSHSKGKASTFGSCSVLYR